MKWEVLETQRNPMQLVEIKGVTKRIRKKIVLTVEQYHALLAELPYHIQVMVMIAMCLGLRVSGIRALQWQDFDLKGRMLTLARSIVGRYVWNGKKTGASEDEVALDSWFPFWRIGGNGAYQRRRDGSSRMWIRNDQFTATPFRRTTCDPQVKRSGCKEWVGTHFDTATEPSLPMWGRLLGCSSASCDMLTSRPL